MNLLEKIVARDSPDQCRVWIENEDGERLAEIDVNNLGPINSLQFAEALQNFPALLIAAENVLSDHEERIRLYPEMNSQLARVEVFKQLQIALEAIPMEG